MKTQDFPIPSKMLTLTRKVSWSKWKSLHNAVSAGGSWRKHNNAAANKAPQSEINKSESDKPVPRPYIKKGPGLEYFLYNSVKPAQVEGSKEIREKHPYVNDTVLDGAGKKGMLTY